MNDFDAITGGLDAPIVQMQQLQLKAAQQYKPVVDGLAGVNQWAGPQRQS